MNEDIENILILGGGQSASYAAQEIRKFNNKSNVSIISNEEYLPYERPPLSKDCLIDKMQFDDCSFFQKEFYEKNNIKIFHEEAAQELDFKSQRVQTSKRKNVPFDKLLIALGSSNKKFVKKGVNTENFFYLRDINESKKIKEKMLTSNNILIIGGGFIGLEIASSALQKGKNVTILEKGEQLMGRVIPKQIADLILEKHESEGTKINLNTQIKNIKKYNKTFKIYLNTNQILTSDLIIIGVGSLPNTDIFNNTSLKIDNGIVTDEFSATSIDDVYAAGDVSNFYHPFYQGHMRLESFKHAQNHGISAGKNIAGLKNSYNAIPWMWSDQFNLNLQLTGICNDYDSLVQRGSSLEEGIIYFFLKNRKIMGACGLGVGGKIGRDIRLAGKLSEKKIKVTKQLLSDKKNKLNKI